jgi:hypothetical protein
MPKYLIERFIPQAGELTAMELKAIAQQTYLVQQELEARIQWLHSIITADRMVCLYVADNEASLREHARRSGLPIKRISIVTAIIGPTIEALVND